MRYGVPLTGQKYNFSLVLYGLGLLAAGLLIYSNAFGVPFVLDDLSNIVLNPEIKHFPDWGRIYLYNPPRFVTNLTFALNHRLHGLDVFGYHAVNILLHIANSMLVFFWVRRLYRMPAVSAGSAGRFPEWAAFFSALLFLAHPVQTSAVSYTVQRAALLMTFFYLAGMIFYLRYRLGGRGRDYALAAAAVFLGMTSKENMVSFPLALILTELCFLSQPAVSWKKRMAAVLPFAILVLLVPVYYFSNHPLRGWQDLTEVTRTTSGISRWEYFLTQSRVIVTYMRLLVFPLHQRLEYDYPLYRSLTEPPVFLSGVFILVLLYAAARLRRREAAVSFGIFFFFAALFPESSIFPMADLIFEHRLYLPAAAFVLVAGNLVWRMAKPPFRGAVLGLIAVTLGLLAYHRNLVWSEPVRLLGKDVRNAPGHERARLNLGNYYVLQNNLEMAVQQYKAAIQSNRQNYQAYNNLGVVYYHQGDRLKARHCFMEAKRIHPNFANPDFHLGRMAYEDNDPDRARGYYEEAIRKNPKLASPYIGMALLLSDAGLAEDALEMARKATLLDPDDAPAFYQLGNLYFQYRLFAEAVKSYEAALGLNPEYIDAYNNLGNVFYVMKEYAKAETQFLKILEMDDGYDKAYYNLANVYRQMGDFGRADDYFKKAKRAATARGNSLMLEKIAQYEIRRYLKPPQSE